MKEIKEAQKKWQKAKADAAQYCQEHNNSDMAQKLNLCSMFKGTETLEEMITLMFSPQGAEFLTRYNFPNIETFRKFKKYHPEQFGVYIDCGKISLSEARKVFLVGDTIAELKYSEIAGNRIILMHGATACIDASGFSIVKIEKDGKSKVEINASDNAKILR